MTPVAHAAMPPWTPTYDGHPRSRVHQRSRKKQRREACAVDNGAARNGVNAAASPRNLPRNWPPGAKRRKKVEQRCAIYCRRRAPPLRLRRLVTIEATCRLRGRVVPRHCGNLPGLQAGGETKLRRHPFTRAGWGFHSRLTGRAADSMLAPYTGQPSRATDGLCSCQDQESD